MLGLVILETELKVISRRLVLLHSKDLPSTPAFHISQGKKACFFLISVISLVLSACHKQSCLGRGELLKLDLW